MAEDLTHLQRHIQKLEAEAADMRRLSQNARIRAQSEQNQGNDARFNFNMIEADKFNEKAEQYDQEAERLRSETSRQEAELQGLKKQLEDLTNKYNSESKALEREIKSKAGTSFSL